MSITNYAELQTAVGSWLNRNDLASVIPDFITLAESKLNRRLRTRYQETALTSQTIVNYEYGIPDGALAIKQFWGTATPKRRIEQKTLDYVIESQISSSTGTPQFVAWGIGVAGQSWIFDASGVFSGVYFAKVPALSAAANWVITKFPDLYLYATLEQASIYLKDIDGAVGFATVTDNLIAEISSISQADQLSGGKLIARVR